MDQNNTLYMNCQQPSVCDIDVFGTVSMKDCHEQYNEDTCLPYIKKEIKTEPDYDGTEPTAAVFIEEYWNCSSLNSEGAKIKVEHQSAREAESNLPVTNSIAELGSAEYCIAAGQNDGHSAADDVQQKNIGTARFSCEQCGKTFAQGGGLSVHARTHTGERPYSCSSCGRCFAQKSNLNKHMATHTGAKPYECQECGRRFSQTSNLHKHMAIHAGERSHPCPECGKCFTQSSNLNKHRRIHSNERPHKCPECGRCFTQTSNLNKHMKVHLGDRPYSCHECGRYFSQSSNLNKHMKVHLNEITNPMPQNCVQVQLEDATPQSTEVNLI